MDKLDYKILSMLKKNGRLSNANMARSLKVSEGTVRRRLKKMTVDNVIRIFAVPNPDSIGLHSEALIGIQVDPDKMEIIANKLDLVSREEFEVQKKILEKIQKDLKKYKISKKRKKTTKAKKS